MSSILITGGTGFFGRHFIKKLLFESEYDRICIYSRDEAKQAAMRLDLNDDHRLRFFIGDVRDQSRLKRATQNIDVIVHAAALKRIEVGAYNPEEMVKTNINGSINVIETAIDNNVKKIIYLSTDKAYQPISPYGQSKALAESLFLAANHTTGSNGPKFAVTRYGNVAGSTGSVIPTWRKILETSCVVPVTDPNATRFWMTIEQAVDLVLNTIKTMPVEVVIPELPTFKLEDLAKAMDAEMNIIGMPEHEKIHECMGAGNCSNNPDWRIYVNSLKKALQHV